MKMRKLFAFAAAGLLFGACSSDEVVVPDGTANGPQWNSEGTGYVNLAINLPTRPAIQKAANDEFSDGTASEYWVNDAILVVFKGTDDATATVANAYDLTLNWNNVDDNPNQITSSAQIVQKINAVDDGLSALVILNGKANGLVEVGTTGDVLMVNDMDMSGKTIEDINKAVADIDSKANWHTGAFLMTNAPLSNGAVAPTVLAPIDETKIFGTEAEAINKPAANIYVERAEAKVTVEKEYTGQLGDANKTAIKVVGWWLDNTNKASYLVRNTSNLTWNLVNPVAWGSYNTQSRMVGQAAVEPNVDNRVRTYWGVDVNYSTDGTQANGLTTLDAGAALGDEAFGMGATAYCFENTTAVNGMTQNNSTRIIMKAEVNDGKNCYVVAGDRSIIYKDQDALDKKVIATYQNMIGAESIEGDVEVTYANLETAGAATVATIAVNGTEVGTDDIAKLNGVMPIDVYKDGAVYYQVYIKHFGDDMTPWIESQNESDPFANPSYTQWDKQPVADDVYPGDDKDDINVLGRYGVLRNNWYQINVTGIKGLGTSTVPTPDTELIDRLESYISVKINILSWALRSQNVTLK